jgi:multisubunit Na+/H+ antiporter MnhF subunit
MLLMSLIFMMAQGTIMWLTLINSPHTINRVFSFETIVMDTAASLGLLAERLA